MNDFVEIICFLSVAIFGACLPDAQEKHAGTKLEVRQSECLKVDLRMNNGEEDETEWAKLVTDDEMTKLQAHIMFNCRVDSVCAFAEKHHEISDLNVLFLPCEETTDRLAKCNCMLDLDVPINLNGIDRVIVRKQDLRHREGKALVQEVVELFVDPE